MTRNEHFTSETGRLDALRLRLSNRLYRLAYDLQPPERGPRCPDCGIGPAEPDPCDICDADAERRAIEAECFDAGRERGYQEAARDIEGGLT